MPSRYTYIYIYIYIYIRQIKDTLIRKHSSSDQWIYYINSIYIYIYGGEYVCACVRV